MKITHASYVAIALSGLIAPVSASVTVVTDFQTNNTDSLPHTYTVSNTDLINGLTPTAQSGNFGLEGTGGVPVLTNGAFPSPITRDTGGTFQFAAFATGGNGGGTSLTYTLAAPANIGSINVFGGWQDQGRDQQTYSIYYATVANPTFTFLSSVDFNPSGSTHPGVTKVSFSDTTGTLASNVTAVRFDFGNVENTYTGYSEIDVNAAVPEPASAVLLLGAAALLTARRRR